ncbi:phage terminase large subunit [Brevibacterium pigmentatum]|uniref:phage terminase large subunit n=1 Tax=Brevibacterium pigmentatum TaxID=1496080 RepID=UPI001D187BEE|nr:phage terminase large subunit [Brevibacterium pigmentatum]
MSVDWMTALADKLESQGQDLHRWETPGELARAIEPNTVQTPALDVIDQALVDVEAGRNDRLILNLPPQEGKSTRVTTFGPLWFLTRNPDRRVAVVSYAQDLAEEFGRNIRNHIEDNQGDEGSLDLGLRIAADNNAIRRFRIAGRQGGVRAVGLSGGLTGKAVDALFIDDPISNLEQAFSKTYRERAWNFWTSVANTRLAPGAPVILVLTRWHEDDLAGRLLKAEDADRWRVINIPAQAEENDPLGRKPGEWLQSARRRTVEQWEQIKTAVGPKVFQSLYQGNPTVDDGGVFPKEWERYEQPMWVERPDGVRIVPGLAENGYEVAQSWDLTFSDTDGSDFVVGQTWLRVGINAYLVDQVRERMNFKTTVDAIKSMSARWPQATMKLVENKANGPAVINALQHSIPGLVPVEPQGSKMSRASAVSPLAFSKNIILPSSQLFPGVDDLIEEARAFPDGVHDDCVDALSQAINNLLLHPLIDQEQLVAEEFADDAIPISYF